MGIVGHDKRISGKRGSAYDGIGEFQAVACAKGKGLGKKFFVIKRERHLQQMLVLPFIEGYLGAMLDAFHNFLHDQILTSDVIPINLVSPQGLPVSFRTLRRESKGFLCFYDEI
jgi:hypothetical protein